MRGCMPFDAARRVVVPFVPTIGVRLFLLLPAAFAADLDFWYGGALSSVSGYQGSPYTMLQAEGDIRLGYGALFAAIDLDYHFDPFLTDAQGNITPISPTYPPEAAYVQLGRKTWFVRAGVQSPAIGLEGWDEWNNYLPTFSLMFDNAYMGRMLGGSVGRYLDDGTELSLFGGVDLDYAYPGYTPIAGASIATEQDSFSTWSGVIAYPADDQYMGVLALELYPADFLSVAIDGGGGVGGESPFAGGELVVALLPEFVVHPAVRGEYVWDPDGYLGAPMASAGVGAKVDCADWMQVGVEGKMMFGSGDPVPGGFAQVTFFRPEDDAPSAFDGGEEEEVPEVTPEPANAAPVPPANPAPEPIPAPTPEPAPAPPPTPEVPVTPAAPAPPPTPAPG